MDQGLKGPAVEELQSGLTSIVPDACRCEMPEQTLWNGRPPRSRTRAGVHVARAALMVLWLAACAGFAWTLYRVLSVETPTVLQVVFLVLSTLCFAWVAIGSVS